MLNRKGGQGDGIVFWQAGAMIAKGWGTSPHGQKCAQSFSQQSQGRDFRGRWRVGGGFGRPGQRKGQRQR